MRHLMYWFRYVPLILIFQFASPLVSNSAPITDQKNNQKIIIDVAHILGPTGESGQAFVPRFSKHLGVRLLLSDTQSLRIDPLPPAPVTVNIREDNLDGLIVASIRQQVFGQSPFAPTQFPSFFGTHFVEFIFNAPVFLDLGRTYLIEVLFENRRGGWMSSRFVDEQGAAGTSFWLGVPREFIHWVFETIVDVTDAAELEAEFEDSDADGVRDSSDTCPETPALEVVDALGCSQAQFCGAVNASVRRGGIRCRRSDWMNNEPLMGPAERDCQVDRGGLGHTDNRCVAAP